MSGRAGVLEPTLWLLFLLVLAQTAGAQSTSAAAPDDRSNAPAENGDSSGGWIPLGPAPVDQAGAGGRGYVLPMEDGYVTPPGSSQFAMHAVAANYFYREQRDQFLISQRYETHTIALDYRHGFKVPRIPRFEIGGHVQFHQRDGGVLNGFIEGFESAWASLTGSRSARTVLRAPGARPPQGMLITSGGSLVYRDAGTGSGIGDVYLAAKVALRDGDPSSKATRVSMRAGVNVASKVRFSEGNFLGVGLSVGRKLVEWAAFHGDIRVTRTLDSTSVWNLPLERWAFGFSAGPELRLTRNSSFTVQIGGSSTPYAPTGAAAFDRGVGDITFGFARRFDAGSRQLTMHLYARENLDLPFQVRWNTDPDLSVGLKATIR